MRQLGWVTCPNHENYFDGFDGLFDGLFAQAVLIDCFDGLFDGLFG